MYSDDELFTSPLTFMGAPYGRPGPGNKAAILGIPFDCGTNMRIGARGGPDSVRQQSALMRRFNPTNADFDPVAALGLVDCGNVRLTPSKIVDAFERTEQAVDRIVQAGAIPITIGGDGSVTVPVARAVGKKHKKMAALHIDSHTDSYPYGSEEIDRPLADLVAELGHALGEAAADQLVDRHDFVAEAHGARHDALRVGRAADADVPGELRIDQALLGDVGELRGRSISASTWTCSILRPRPASARRRGVA